MSSGLPSHVDAALLKRFEPILRFTRGERFFPMDVERFIGQCSLWVQAPNEPPRLIVPPGELSLDRLTEARKDGFGSVLYLKFIDPLDLVELARYSFSEAVKHFTHEGDEYVFHAGRGRLARVGYFSRFIDALFSLTLLMRGRVPGDTAAAAAIQYKHMLAEKESYCYYGRVIRQNDWIILQYWFFYPFNNWRSGFFGVNDHEGDWEMITIYCVDERDGDHTIKLEDRVRPYWVAYASHDYAGDDLRRHWDDPEVEKVGDHPVVYAGAGSHASYFKPGEYLTELELKFLSPLTKTMEKIKAVWAGALRQSVKPNNGSGLQLFRIPFVDYARGDGFIIGPGQDRVWEQVVLNPVPAWVREYRGLWGLYVRDPVAGEDAPGGPMYNRDGSVRLSWFDPLAWAGVDKVPPPNEALAILDMQKADIHESRYELENEIIKKSAQLSRLGIQAEAMQGYPHLSTAYQQQQALMQSFTRELTGLRRQMTLYDAKLEALKLHEARILSGEVGPSRDHIRRPFMPSSEVDLRLGGLAEIFSALSVGLVMMVIVLLIVFAREFLFLGLATMIGLLVFIESSFRRQLTRLITSITVALAVLTAAILVYEFFWTIIIASVLIAGFYIIWENIREIRR
jgi:hypothetical protein